jgi:hypothetical protein
LQSAIGGDIGEKLKAEEKLSANDPQYWMRRFEYSHGLKDSAGQEEALIRGLAVAKPIEGQKGKGGYCDDRSVLLAEYLNFLIEHGGKVKARTLALKEVKEAPPISGSSATAVWSLVTDFSGTIDPGDKDLWAWLAGRPVWYDDEEYLIKAMLKNADVKRFEEFLSKAEVLASGKELSRRYVLATVMTSFNLDQRAKPLFEYVIKNDDAPNGFLKQTAAFALYDMWLRNGEWRNAEKYILAGRNPSRAELVQFAICATKAGDKADAVRFWKMAANVEPANMTELKEFAALGLKKELREFYSSMKKELPSSLIPDMAFSLLGSLTD